MNTLFDTDDETGDTVTAPDLATTKQVRLLEGFGYRTETVRRWTREKAEVTLRSCQNEHRIALNRAAATAAAIDNPEKRCQPSDIERANAALYLEQAQAHGADELLQAVAYSLYVCTDDEVRRLSGYLVKLWRVPVPGRGPVRDDAPPPDEQVQAPEGP